MKEDQLIETDFFYFIEPAHKYCICDPSCCAESDRTFDMSLYDLANNESVLNTLSLYYMQGNYGVKYTYESRATWFCGYLSSFRSEDDGRYEHLLTNPNVRLLISDEKMLSTVKKLLTKC